MRFGSVRCGAVGLRCGRPTVRYGTVRHGTARHGTARHGTARHGTVRCGVVMVWYGIFNFHRQLNVIRKRNSK